MSRPNRLARTALIIALIGLIVYLSGHLWYAGDGWCIGSMYDCVKL